MLHWSLSLIFIVFLAGCSLAAPGETQDRAALESRAGVVIPASAGGVHGEIVGIGDTTTHLRFDIPASDLDEFMKSTACTTPLSDGDIRQQLQGLPDRPWWAPEKADTFGSCMAATEHLAQLIFVDTTDPDRYIVYVIAATK